MWPMLNLEKKNKTKILKIHKFNFLLFIKLNVKIYMNRDYTI